jgi:RNA polymerase sigma factor (sigma-70 family)
MNQVETAPLPVLSDEQTIGRILDGENHLYEIIMRRYNRRLYRIAMSILGNSEEAEDIMQATYLKAYEHLEDFQFKSGFGTWLTRIVINESLQSLRRTKRSPEFGTIEDQAELNKQTPLEHVMNDELRTVLEKSLTRLPEKYRVVFVMREVEEMSVSETMDCLSLTESNVKVRLKRAKEMLRDSLSTHYRATEIYGFHLTRCNRVVSNVLARIESRLNGINSCNRANNVLDDFPVRTRPTIPNLS